MKTSQESLGYFFLTATLNLKAIPAKDQVMINVPVSSTAHTSQQEQQMNAAGVGGTLCPTYRPVLRLTADDIKRGS